MRKRRLYFTGTVIAIIVIVGGIFVATESHHRSIPVNEKVMTIGGSVAHGWKDVKGEGYLHRALQTYQTATNVFYAYYNRTIVGANGHQLATMYKGDYSKWLTAIHPTVVVLSWGLLNDALPKTTYSKFAYYLKQEIQEALQYHAVVLVVSPPITKAAYTQYPIQEKNYDKQEALVVKSLKNPNVYYIDLLNQMKAYLKAHHQTYKPYEGDGWHPNTRGHILAGNLLEQDILNIFGKGPISFKQ